MFEDLTDYPQAKHLAAALWRQEGQARGAALVVGAGVSTMAHTASENTPRPPLWRDLAKSLGARLYPNDPERAPTDALRLAQEYQSYFGQAALNAHLRELITDNAWFPSDIHKRLLQLPWADILTTNYDTLLERAAAEVLTPAYDFVRSATDLVHARQPRIVKLHGNISDDSPMVLTEEDYRTYPSRNAAMVNLARQVFIENELCLLGFSGDDPNFLQWTGWVRDHLMGSHRKIYLVGVLHLSPSARKLLEDRNIAPIDLTDLVKDMPKSDQHAAATANFLNFLEQSKPAPAYEWKLDQESFNTFIAADTQEERNRLAAQQNLRNRMVRWRAERALYPGWAICPTDYSVKLKHSCHSASSDMRLGMDSLDPKERSEFLSEFVWRCRVALFFPTDEQRQWLEKFVQGDGSSVLLASQIDCALLLLTAYRISNSFSSFTTLAARLETAELKFEQQSWFDYERALLSRDLMHLEDLRTLLEKVDGEDPMWKLRRAALACDLNMWEYARQQWLQAKADIRRRAQAERQSIWTRSRRALLDFVSMIDWESNSGTDFSESRARNIQDRISHCDPWEYVEHARRSIQQIRNARSRLRDATHQLAYGRGNFRSNHGEESTAAYARELRSEFQYWEDCAGIPIRFKESSLPQLAAEAWALAPELTLSCTLRMTRTIHSSRDYDLNPSFSRLTLARLSKSTRNEIISTVLNACEFWIDRIKRAVDEDAARSDQKSLGDTMKVLARFIVAADAETAEKALNFAFSLAENNQHIKWREYEALDVLFEGAISALPVHDASLALRCIAMPLASELKERCMERLWPEPTQWFSRFDAAQTSENSSASTARIDQLLSAARRSGLDRTQALTRLNSMLRLGLLSTEQKAAFGDALWSKVDGGTPGLPAESPFRLRALRSLPAPPSLDVASVLQQRLFSVVRYARPEESAIRDMISVATDVNPVLPTTSSAAEMLDIYLNPHPWLQTWLDGSSDESSHQIRLRRDWLGLVIGRALVPSMDSSELTADRLAKLLDLMDKTVSASAVTALPYFAKAQPIEASKLVYRVQVALLSAVSGDVAGGAIAVRTWLSDADLRACLTDEQVYLLQELLLTAVTASSRIPHVEAVKTVHAVLVKNSDLANTQRLVKMVQVLLRRTHPDQVEHDSEGEETFSIVRAEVLRMAKTLLDTGNVDGIELHDAVAQSNSDAMPEIRFALLS